MSSAPPDLPLGARAAEPHDRLSPAALAAALLIVALYAALRLLAWEGTVLIDDTDSMLYLRGIDAVHALDWSAYDAIDADLTPLYPALGGLGKALSGDSVTGGRLASFVASLLLVLALGALARRLDGATSALLAMTLLAVQGLMISLSIAVLTEVSYLALVYLGLWLLWEVVREPRLRQRSAFGLGALFALAFLDRTEGILFVAAVPVAVVVFAGVLAPPGARPGVGRMAGWIGSFVLVFALLATPQILHVTSKMGATAINGRVAWQALVSALPETMSTNRKVFGLDLAEDTVNIVYMRERYAEGKAALAALHEGEGGSALLERARRAASNADVVYRDYVGELIGPFGFALALLALAMLYLSGATRVFAYCLFIGAVTVAVPISHTSVIPRQLSAAIPLLCLLQAIGLRRAAGLLTLPGSRLRLPPAPVLAVLTLALLAGHAFPLKHALRPPVANPEYDPAFIAEPVAFVRALDDAGSVSAQRQYIAYLSGSSYFDAPYVGYDELVRYLRLNEVSLFYVDVERLAAYPYIDAFLSERHARDFELLWRGEVEGAPRAMLFRVLGAGRASPERDPQE